VSRAVLTALAALLLAALCTPAAAAAAEPPGCEGSRASRWVDPIENLDPRPGAPRVFAMQVKQDARHVVTYASFRRKVECLLREVVVPRKARDRPNVVVFDEDIGLLTIATGSRGRTAREVFADPDSAAGCSAAPCGALSALQAVGAEYGRESAAYRARFPGLPPIVTPFVAATDTFARGWMATFSDLAREYGVYMAGSNNQALFTESTDPADIALFADPDLEPRPSSVFVATAPEVYNEAFLWGPQDVRADGPRMLRNVVASNKKVPLTSLEEALQISNGPATLDNVRPFRIPGTEAVVQFATSLPAFTYGPPTPDPCGDIRRHFMRCLDRLGVNVVLQDEANPGRWASYTAPDSPDRGAWQTLSWNTSTWRSTADPAVGFAYNVTPHLVGNLADLPFDGQSAITQRGLRTGPGCAYVGSSRFVPGKDPERFAIGGEDLAARPYAGPKTEFLAMAPWVVPDAPREQLEPVSAALDASGNGRLENDYVETALVADLPFPPRPDRRSCAGTPAASSPATGPDRAPSGRLRVAVSPRRVRAGRTVRLRIRLTRAGRPAAGVVRTSRGGRVRVGRAGRAGLRVRFARPGRYVLRAGRDRATVRVLPRPR
jgi:hypothetical protein